MPCHLIGQSQTIQSRRRFQLNDSVSLQHGGHAQQFGIDGEHNRGENLVWNNQPVTLTLFSPDQVRAYNVTSATSQHYVNTAARRVPQSE